MPADVIIVGAATALVALGTFVKWVWQQPRIVGAFRQVSRDPKLPVYQVGASYRDANGSVWRRDSGGWTLLYFGLRHPADNFVPKPPLTRLVGEK